MLALWSKRWCTSGTNIAENAQSASQRTFFQSSFGAKDLVSTGFGTLIKLKKTGEEGICMSSCTQSLCVAMRFRVVLEFGSALDRPVQKVGAQKLYASDTQ